MYVIADIEWVTSCDGTISPVQLAAVRVDENWNKINSYFSYIKPLDGSFHDWTQLACNGGSKSDFLMARSAEEVFRDLLRWLDGDTLLWWLDQSKELFSDLAVELLGNTELPEAISISKYVQAFLEGQPHSRSNVYALAASRGVVTKPPLKHCSDNDVRVIRELMKAIEYPQPMLLNPVVFSETQKTVLNLLYIYDKSTNTIHANGCESISDGEFIGYPNFSTALRKGYKACKCCRGEFLKALRERNLDILSRISYKFVFSPHSSVFHTPNCRAILSARVIQGTGDYSTAVDKGRVPCRICNPTPSVKSIRTAAKPKKATTNSTKESNRNEIRKAIVRQQAALKERSERLNDSSLSETEKKDIITLTQPGFAFWAGHGYNNFHLRSCPNLTELSQLHGYRTYREALQDGRTPCKVCKPSAKNDAVLSIPITNRKRGSESVYDIKRMCQNSGFSCQYDEEFFYLQTPVGKWKIDLNSYPVRLYHINLMVDARTEEYHTQPRVFLSLTDTFLYIKRHDASLTCKPRY